MSFSVITVNFNDAIGLERTIISVISQTCRDYEYIIIDGGSTDGSLDVIKKYNDYITYWVSEKDRGIYHAMNKGILQAHGEYCIFMNSRDVFFNSNVLYKVSLLAKGEDIIVGNAVSKYNNRLLFSPPLREISLYYLYSGTVPHQSSFIKVELQKKYLYDENLRIVSDWKFFLQTVILSNCSIKYIDENISYFDLDGISTSNPEIMWNEKVSVLKNMFPHRVLLDYQLMKQSECMIQTLTPELRTHYRIDRLLFRLGMVLIKIVNVLHG